MNTAQARPDTAKPEQPINPLTQQDYGTAAALTEISRLAQLPGVSVRVATKVSCPTRYVIEIEVNSDGGCCGSEHRRNPIN